MDIKPCDILLVHGAGITAWSIQAITHSRFNHVALVDAHDGMLIEADAFRTLGHREMTDYKGRSIIMRYEPLTDEQREKILAFAHSQFGKRYDYEEILDQFERYVFNVKEDETEDPNRFICSTFINAAFKSAGISLVDVPMPSPGDFYLSKKLTIVGRY